MTSVGDNLVVYEECHCPGHAQSQAASSFTDALPQREGCGHVVIEEWQTIRLLLMSTLQKQQC